MPILVDDIGKSLEWLKDACRERGLRAVSAGPTEGIPCVEFAIESGEEFLDLAKAVGSVLVYLDDTPHPMAPRAGEALASFEEKTGGDAGEDARSLRRALQLWRDVGYAHFEAGFAHGGILHTVTFADREAWPAVVAWEISNDIRDEESADEDERADEVEGDFADLAAMSAEEGAERIIRHLEADGISRREMRRDSARLATVAARHLLADAALDESARKRVRAAEQEAARRMRRGG